MAIVNTNIKQKTIKNEVSLNGVGLHTGTEVILTFKPAPENFGFRFKRNDLEGEPVIEADANYVTNTQRGTCLEKNGVIIQTCEHVLAALVGLDVDNAIIELNASEPPIMDGSSKFFVEAIEKAGITEQDADRDFFEIKEKKIAQYFERLHKQTGFNGAVWISKDEHKLYAAAFGFNDIKY